MSYKVDYQKQRINFLDYNKIVSSIYFVPSYLIWEFSQDVNSEYPLILQKEDGVLYDNIDWLMKQNYMFSHNYSYKEKDLLIWFSEHCFNIEDMFQRDLTPRLIINKDNNDFNIYYRTPYFEYSCLDEQGAIISFAPAGNGYMTKNTKSNISFQDDMVYVFNSTINNKRLIRKK